MTNEENRITESMIRAPGERLRGYVRWTLRHGHILWMVAAGVGLHPVQSEAFAWISARNDRSLLRGPLRSRFLPTGTPFQSGNTRQKSQALHIPNAK